MKQEIFQGCHPVHFLNSRIQGVRDKVWSPNKWVNYYLWAVYSGFRLMLYNIHSWVFCVIWYSVLQHYYKDKFVAMMVTLSNILTPKDLRKFTGTTIFYHHSLFWLLIYKCQECLSFRFPNSSFQPVGMCPSMSHQQRAAECLYVRGVPQTATFSSCSHMLTASLTGSLLK